MTSEALQNVVSALGGSVEFADNRVTVKDEESLRKQIEKLARISALSSGDEQSWARYLTRLIALELGIGPASIHELYMARGRGEIPPIFSVPAMNLRMLTFEAARCIFREAMKINAAAFIFEIARSEIGYTEQRPAEYATSVLAAAIAEGYRGPVFIQGDHFQISPKRYAENPDLEIAAVEELTVEALQAGFYNIDIDTSTLVDINQVGEPAQQKLNSELSAHFTKFIRKIEPEGVTVSVGGEIGEVGKRNSNAAELRAYADGYRENLGDDLEGLSKISIQTGTSHGGVVLPDGSVAKVKVDFDTLLSLSRVARDEYRLAGAVQHGASTLPDDAFGKFVESEACEVHLATNFQNIVYERVPKAFLDEVYAYVDQTYADSRKSDQTDEQFRYENRKRAVGPFKAKLWDLPEGDKKPIIEAWEQQFAMLFSRLAIANTREFVEKYVPVPMVAPHKEFYFGEERAQEEVKDLAD